MNIKIINEEKHSQELKLDYLGIDWLKVARSVLLSRELDRLEEEQLTPQRKVKFQFSSAGHELVQVLLAHALDHPHDAAMGYYRSRSFMLASGISPSEALAAGMARSGAPSEGRDVGVIFNKPRENGLTILPTSGDVGAQFTPIAGWAQTIIYRQRVLEETDWEGAVAAAMGGDGSVTANGFWAAMNIATTLLLPMLFLIENNNYGISTPAALQTPNGNISANLASFGNLKTLDGDGTDPIETWELISTAVDHIRKGEGPCLLHMNIPRLSGHTFIDDQAYKSEEEMAADRDRDPVNRLKKFLTEQGLTEEAWDSTLLDVKAELAQAVELAESRPEPDPSQTRRYLFYEEVPQQQGGLRTEGALIPIGSATPHPAGPRINFIDAVRRTLEVEMSINPRLLVFGEDVGVKGGVHGATMDMQSHFGSERVFDTSLSEDGIIGRAQGMALAGLLPVPEIQFRKYADPAYEQISDIGSIRWRTANRFAAPVVVRIPVGFGKNIGDPWHSVSGEAIFAHTLGWHIAYPSNASDAVGLLRTALRSDDPTLFLEHRALLDTREARQPYPGDDFSLPFGDAALLSEGDELTVITWGAMTPRCVEAGRAFQGRVTILDLRTIIPWDQEAVLESVRNTGKALIVHEDTLTAGFAGEIIAAIASQAFTYLDAPIERLGVPDVFIPFNPTLMNAVVPDAERIRQKIDEMLSY